MYMKNAKIDQSNFLGGRCTIGYLGYEELYVKISYLIPMGKNMKIF
jgi:hypothetical protein